MSPLEYLQWLYKERAYTKKIVIMSILLSRYDEPIPNPVKGQVGFANKKHNFWNGQEWIELDSTPTVTDGIVPAYLSYNVPIKLPSGSFPNVKKDIDTQVGNVVINILCLLHPFYDRINFIEGQFSASKIESFINPQFVDIGKDGITQPMVEKYAIAVRMLMSIAGIITAAATRKNTVPPPGVEAFKKELAKNLDLTKSLDQSRYTAALLKYDAEWLKDDPTLGILLSGKVRDKARLKLYMSFASESTFGPPGTTTEYVTQALNSGIPTTKKEFAALFSAARAASFSRGKLTAIGGVLAKLLARIVADVSILDTDCGTTKYLPVFITPASTPMIGRYAVIDNREVLVTKDVLVANSGKFINFRSPGYCKSEETSFCRHCAGEMMYNLRESVRLASQDLGGTVLSFFLSMFHGLNREPTKLEFDQIAC